MSATSTKSLSSDLPILGGSLNPSRRSSGLALVKGYAPHGYRLHMSNHTSQAAPIVTTTPHVHRDVSTRFGQRLRQLRIERKLTQVRMAREFGVDRSYISDVERGRKSVSLPTMEILALGLNVSLAELLDGI